MPVTLRQSGDGVSVVGFTSAVKVDILISKPYSGEIFSADGQLLGRVSAEVATPTPILPARLDEVERRLAVCESCQHSRGVTRLAGRFAVYSVSCDLCGCGGLKAEVGPCPANKWPGVTGVTG